MSHKHTENSLEKTRESEHTEAHVADKDTACSVNHSNTARPCEKNLEDDAGVVRSEC